MTHEDLERAIEFLVKQQAGTEERVTRLENMMGNTINILGTLIKTEADLARNVSVIASTVVGLADKLDKFIVVLEKDISSRRSKGDNEANR